MVLYCGKFWVQFLLRFNQANYLDGINWWGSWFSTSISLVIDVPLGLAYLLEAQWCIHSPVSIKRVKIHIETKNTKELRASIIRALSVKLGRPKDCGVERNKKAQESLKLEISLVKARYTIVEIEPKTSSLKERDVMNRLSHQYFSGQDKLLGVIGRK